jgi:hypothetical protein
MSVNGSPLSTEVSRGRIRLGHEPSEGMEDSQTTEGLNVRIRRRDYGIYHEARTAETRKRTPELSWKPEAEGHAGGAERSETTGKGNAMRKRFFLRVC